MLKPSVQMQLQDGVFVAEFWDCLRLDPAPVQDLRSEFEAHLRRKGSPDLVIDLLGVGFAGSAALGGFVALQRTARQHGGRMIFCNVDPTVYEVFRVSKLVGLYTFVSDRAAAIAQVLAGPAASAGESAPSPAPDAATLPGPGSAPKPKGGSLGGPLRRRKAEG